MRVEVAAVPPADAPRDRTCLVVDVLRATSVMAVLFGRGARALYPAGSVEAARALRGALEADGPVLLCGEVGGLPPDGFDFGNSPLEFASLAALPAERAVVTTSNGTPALMACSGAPLTLTAAPLNASTAVALALEPGRDVLVVCSGLRREPAEDDLLAAGLIVARLVETGAEPEAAARQALERYRAAETDLAAALRASEHGQRLVALGFGEDIDFCAQPDRYGVTGMLAVEAGQPVLRPARPEGGER
ncbi:MAG: 2-phosphosulfolactate phosphatase [Dehalococcoidia bacterium]|nr:2-phosphosulfolactate phosphatase [Dehalococcoidia bacterium]